MDHFRKTSKAQLNYRKCAVGEEGCAECRHIVRSFESAPEAGQCQPIGLEKKVANMVRRGYRCDRFERFDDETPTAA